MKNRSILPLTFVFIFLASCQKEISFDNGGSDSITGEWNFLGMSGSTNATITAPTPLGETKVITTAVFRSTGNSGTVTITATEFIFNNVSYSIDTTINVKTYLAGFLVDNNDMPFTFSQPALTDTSAYTRISSDSLSVAAFAGIPDPTGMLPVGPVGLKIGWSGDTLLLKTRSNIAQNISQGGVTATLAATVNVVTKLKRR